MHQTKSLMFLTALLVPLAFGRATEIYPLRKGPVRPFWEDRLDRKRVRYDGGRSLKVSLWQSKFSLENGAFVLGGQKFVETDAHLPATHDGTCSAVNGPHFFARSKVRFCRGPATTAPPFVTVNGSAVEATGQVGLSEDAVVTLAVHWPSGAEIQFLLRAPASQDIDFVRDDPRTWRWTREVPGAYGPPKSNEPGQSLPRRPRTADARITSSPFRQTLAGPFGVEFSRILEWGTRPVPIAADVPRLGSPYGASGAGRTFRTRVESKTGESAWLVFDKLESGNQDYEFEFEEIKYHGSVTRVPHGELSGLLSGLLSTKNYFILSGEADVVYHPDGPFGENLDGFWSHRFGLHARGFGALATFKNFTPYDAIPLGFQSLEGRVLVKRGSWNLDEVVGGLVSYNNFHLYTRSQTYVGLGVFWGRPLPSIFDRWLNRVSWLSYPKYVDLDVSYLKPTGKGTTNAGLIVNAHGKMLIGTSWFAEGALGYMRVQTDRNSLEVLLAKFGGGWLF